MSPLSFREPPKRRTLRVRRRRTRLLAILVLATFVILSAYGVRALSYLPRFSIDHVEISGAEEVEPEIVQSVVEKKLEGDSFTFLSPRNIFFYPRRAIETTLQEYFPRIESAKVARESLLATAISVTVKERDAFARWCTKGFTDSGDTTFDCYAMDTTGYIFAPATTSARFATAYVFEGAFAASTGSGQAASSTPLGQTYLPGRFAGVLALLERLGQAGISAEKVWLEGEQDFSVMLSRGFEIHAAFGTDVGLLVKNLELVLASEALRGKEDQLEYIDLRFGNRVYYKLKGGEKGEF